MTTQPRSYVYDLGRVQDLARAIARGELSPVTLVETCLARIEQVDPFVQAWRLVDKDRALATARERAAEARAGRLRGPLHGIPFGIKDVIDVEGLDTLCNSESRRGSSPAQSDAEQVAAMKSVGAIVLGKVHTTEFSYFDPPPTCNPHNLRHTPGGSSSGSAAAVAAGTVPVTLGTQTLSSTNRPAAYCGISAFKPSTRALSAYGITPLAPSSDTLGIFGATVADAVYVFDAISPAYLTPCDKALEGKGYRIAFLEDPHLELMQPGVMDSCRALMQNFASAGARVDTIPSPISFARLNELQNSTVSYEIGRTLGHLISEPIGALLRRAIEDGRSIRADRYLDERREMDRMRVDLFGDCADVDAFLWPAAPGPAPEGLASTGDPRFIAPWTALGGPILTVPTGKASNGLPLGCILSGAPGRDVDLSILAKRFLG